MSLLYGLRDMVEDVVHYDLANIFLNDIQKKNIFFQIEVMQEIFYFCPRNLHALLWTV